MADIGPKETFSRLSASMDLPDEVVLMGRQAVCRIGLRAGALASFLLSIVAAPALACSPPAEFLPPTNYELIQRADAIVVARVVSGQAVQTDRRATPVNPYQSSTQFRIESKLKGDAPAELDIKGFVIGRAVPSDPNELAKANPEAYFGACNRNTLEVDKLYVLILKKDENRGWSILPYVFARTSEDYFGPDSLWVRTIRTYADLQARFAPAAQADEMERLLAARKAEPPSAVRDAEAADVLAYLQHVGRAR